MKDKITTIINAKIYNINEENDVEEALVTKGNKIVYVGSNKGAIEF